MTIMGGRAFVNMSWQVGQKTLGRVRHPSPMPAGVVTDGNYLVSCLYASARRPVDGDGLVSYNYRMHHTMPG